MLTDGPYFGGTVDDLHARGPRATVPVLRKDFVLDEVQVFETRAVGADAMLLIVAAISDDALLADLHALAVELGLTVLVEAHDGGELERALAMRRSGRGRERTRPRHLRRGPRRRRTLGSAIPPDVVAVAESAIRLA